MSVANITVAGQKVGLKFGMPALRRIMEKMQQYELITGGRSNDLGLSHILYAGYLNYCLMRDEAPAIDFQPFYEYVEQAPDSDESRDELRAAVRIFEQSRYIKALVEKKKATETKENSIGTTSNPSVTENSDTAHETITGSPGESTSLP